MVKLRDLEGSDGPSHYVPPVAVGAGGNVTVWTPTAEKQIKLKWFSVSVDATTRIVVSFGGNGWIAMYLPTNGSYAINLVGCNKLGGSGNALIVASSNACNISATASGTEE